jgi:hypothetical protein
MKEISIIHFDKQINLRSKLFEESDTFKKEIIDYILKKGCTIDYQTENLTIFNEGK